EAVEAAELQRRGEAGEIPGCVVQGPLSFDLAYTADAGAKKRVGGPVPGAADVMLFPNLAAANLTVKAIMYTADCRFGGVLCGAACPGGLHVPRRHHGHAPELPGPGAQAHGPCNSCLTRSP